MPVPPYPLTSTFAIPEHLTNIPSSTAGVQLSNAWASDNSLNPASYTPSQQDVRDFDNSRSQVRDTCVSRGRDPAPANIATQSQQPSLVLSPRSQSSLGRARSPAGLNGGLEQRPSASASHAHFRQASRVNGTYQQTRNVMFVSSPATSPSSPETPGSANVDASLPDFSSLTMIRRGSSLRHQNESPSGTANGISTHRSTTSTLIGDRDLAETNNTSLMQKRSDRTQPSRSRRGHSHHHSQSKHSQEQKSVGEYALHHLFNQVSF